MGKCSSKGQQKALAKTQQPITNLNPISSDDQNQQTDTSKQQREQNLKYIYQEEEIKDNADSHNQDFREYAKNIGIEDVDDDLLEGEDDIKEEAELEEIYKDPRMIQIANHIKVADEKRIEMLADMQNIIKMERIQARKEERLRIKEENLDKIEEHRREVQAIDLQRKKNIIQKQNKWLKETVDAYEGHYADYRGPQIESANKSFFFPTALRKDISNYQQKVQNLIDSQRKNQEEQSKVVKRKDPFCNPALHQPIFKYKKEVPAPFFSPSFTGTKNQTNQKQSSDSIVENRQQLSSLPPSNLQTKPKNAEESKQQHGAVLKLGKKSEFNSPFFQPHFKR